VVRWGGNAWRGRGRKKKRNKAIKHRAKTNVVLVLLYRYYKALKVKRGDNIILKG